MTPLTSVFWITLKAPRDIHPGKRRLTVTDGGRFPGWAYGDTSVVYPGPNGRPIDSIRWEVFAESLQDYALLQTLQTDPRSPLFREFKDFDQFPKNEAWIHRARQQLLA
ncbi:MAG: DUF4091 domain-containing protein [Verrucomicrobiae bacterium]|nr:DUF4091 domain-containing protein [Verrucomicrobiae bacterium]